MTEATVTKLKIELEEILTKNPVDHRHLNEILGSLLQIEMDLELLQKTKIGLTVNKVRKEFKNAQLISKKTSEIIRKWKKIARDEIRISISSDGGNSDHNDHSHGHDNDTIMLSPVSSKRSRGSEDVFSSKDSEPTTSVTQEVHSNDNLKSNNHNNSIHKEDIEMISNVSSGNNRKSQQNSDTNPSPISQAVNKSDEIMETRTQARVESPCPPSPKDPTRSKSVELLEEGLRSHDSLSKLQQQVDVGSLAKRIENAIYREFKETDRHYKSRVRSRVTNLRDAENGNLRQRVLRGLLNPNRLASMTAEELASEKMKLLRKSISEEVRHDHDLPDLASSQCHSSMFRCYQCGDRDTSYSLSQERLDGEFEPVAVSLVVCNKCGNRWKSY